MSPEEVTNSYVYYFSGDTHSLGYPCVLAYYCIWSGMIQASDVEALSNGANPLAYSSPNITLLRCYPFVNDLNDHSGKGGTPFVGVSGAVASFSTNNPSINPLPGSSSTTVIWF